MDRDSIIELQKLDCNCNDCVHMVRDLDTYNKYKEKQRVWQQEVFKKKKAHAIESALSVEDEKQRKGMLRKAKKMQIQYNYGTMINYGHCNKFDKSVTFIPGVCQLETQDCFKHRRDKQDQFGLKYN